MARTQLALVVIFAASVFGCPPNYSTWFNGWCFNVYAGKFDFDASRNKCALEGARLPVIRSAQENEAFVQQMKAHFSGSMQLVYLGLNCTSTATLSWEDGTPANYTNFDMSDSVQLQMPTLVSQEIDMLSMWMDHGSSLALWTKNSSLACQSTLVVFTEVKQRDGAEETCKKDNSHLISIHDKNANDFVKRTALANGFTDGIHIGLNYKNGNYSWSDGTSYDYSNFATGYPNDKYGNCVAMQTSFFPGQWMNSPCITNALPFICSRMIVYEPVQPATCPTTTEFVEGSEIYSPSYPRSSGVIACNYFVLVNATKKASVQVKTFESNGCCNTLTIYDGAFGHNVIRTLSGSISPGTVFTATGSQMRLAHNATSGNNVKGFHLQVQAI